MAQWFQFTSWPYIIGESLLIFAFTFFYVAVVFNSLEQADNLKKYGGFIPGIRPGRPTAQYLESVLVRLTVAGSLFLATVAAAPTLFIKFGGFSTATARALGGTSRADRGRRCHRYHASDRVAAFDAQLQGLPEVGRRCLST